MSPIYDCASCLYPALKDDNLKEILQNEEEKKARVFIFPNSALKLDNHKINYYDFISSKKNEDCNAALKRIFPKIDLNLINKIIDNTPFISEIRKEFYKEMIELRYRILLKNTYEDLN